MFQNRVDLFSREECDRIRDVIHKLRPHWIHRDAAYQTPFYTLGYATYDAKEDLKDYYREAPNQNQLLRRELGWVYDKLSQAVEKAVGRPTIYDEQLALPGFHIFLAHKVFELPLAAIHWDMQHLHLDWTGKDVSFEDTISFTAAIRLPQGGAGLNVWDLNLKDMEKLTPQECEAAFKDGPREFVEYQTGKMIVHSGDIIHQIAPMKNMMDTDERITLQGWGIQSKGGYILYW